jgi:hypothetical protein
MRKHIVFRFFLLSMALCVMCTLHPTSARDGGNYIGEGQIQRGFEIAPVPLNLTGKDRALVGLGSYIVNAQAGCNDCHTHPSYLPGGDPFQGQKTQINAAQYLTGGRQFPPSPFTSRNLTPDPTTGLPAGLTLDQFLNVLHTGQDPDNPGQLLQIMPWPVYGNMVDHDLRAIYEYLRAIPSHPDNPTPGP